MKYKIVLSFIFIHINFKIFVGTRKILNESNVFNNKTNKVNRIEQI